MEIPQIPKFYVEMPIACQDQNRWESVPKKGDDEAAAEAGFRTIFSPEWLIIRELCDEMPNAF